MKRKTTPTTTKETRARLRSKKRFMVVVIVIAVAALGTYLLTASHAASPSVSNEAENGSLGTNASIQTNTGASGSKYVRFGSLSVGSTCSSVFTASVFCMPITNPVAVSNSAAMASSFVSQYTNNYGTVAVNDGDFGVPIYRVSASQPYITMTPSCASSSDYTKALQVPVPSGAQPAAGTDHSMIIYQASTNKEWEFWEVVNTNGSFTACDGGELDNVSTNSGTFPLSGSQLASSGISYLATTITESDVQSGAINHALAFAILQCNGYIPPARSNYDCGSGIIPYGQYFYFPNSVQMPSGLTPLGQMIFKAIQKYGFVITDYAGAVAVSAETPTGWQASGGTGDPITSAMNGQAEYNIITNLPWSQLQAVNEP